MKRCLAYVWTELICLAVCIAIATVVMIFIVWLINPETYEHTKYLFNDTPFGPHLQWCALTLGLYAATVAIRVRASVRDASSE